MRESQSADIRQRENESLRENSRRMVYISSFRFHGDELESMHFRKADDRFRC